MHALAPAILTSCVAMVSHAFVSADATRAISHRWRPESVAIADGVLVNHDALNSYIRVQIALADASDAGRCGLLVDWPDLSILVMDTQQVSRHVVRAVLWGPHAAQCKPIVFGSAFRFYQTHFPDVCLEHSFEEEDDVEAWERA